MTIFPKEPIKKRQSKVMCHDLARFFRAWYCYVFAERKRGDLGIWSQAPLLASFHAVSLFLLYLICPKCYNGKVEYVFAKRQQGKEITMFLIAGLGNPGREYANTRHNVGFDVIDKLAEQENIRILEKKHKAVTGKGVIEGCKVILAKPQTYMNLSGESIRELADYYKIDEKSELIVISDDISLPPGQLRIRKKGSAGGHNGLKNIIALLGHDEFQRIRLGVGEKPEGYDLADYVLGHFDAKERKLADEAVSEAADAVRVILTKGVEAAMNRFNGKHC